MDFEAKPWRCPRCHEPMGYTTKRRGGRRTLVIYGLNSPGVKAEISGDAVIYCETAGCSGSRNWRSDFVLT